MHVRTEIDISVVLKVFATVLKKISFATNNALTRVAKEMRDEGQKEIAADFTIRKRFILTRLKILQYSKVSDLTAIVGIDAKVQGSPLLLGMFEEGGTKEPAHGSELAVPITGSPARPSFQDQVPTALRYSRLQFVAGKGKKKTFIVPGVGIFERIAPGNSPDATVLIYKFESSAPLKKHMNLIAVMVEVVNARFNVIFWEEFDKEITKQRPRK